jgi:ketosteroid isomerase-like protein
MDPQDNVKVVKQGYDNFRTGNIPALLDQLAERVEWQLPEMEGVPLGGKRKGRDGVAGFFSKLAEIEDVISFEPREFIAQGDKVVALGTYAFRVKGTRREFTSDFAHVFTVQNGKIARFQEYMDTAQAVIAYQQKAAA